MISPLSFHALDEEVFASSNLLYFHDPLSGGSAPGLEVWLTSWVGAGNFKHLSHGHGFQLLVGA